MLPLQCVPHTCDSVNTVRETYLSPFCCTRLWLRSRSSKQVKPAVMAVCVSRTSIPAGRTLAVPKAPGFPIGQSANPGALQQTIEADDSASVTSEQLHPISVPTGWGVVTAPSMDPSVDQPPAGPNAADGEALVTSSVPRSYKSSQSGSTPL